MGDYLENILHQTLKSVSYEGTAQLSLALRSSYEFVELILNEKSMVAATPKERFHLSQLRRDYHQMTACSEYPCFLCLKDMTYYSADVMVKEGIAFVWEGHQVYLPFLGIVLDGKHRSPYMDRNRISFLTQKMLLTALYEGWQDINAADAADRLDVSRMSITRCFDELEALNVPYLKMTGRTRKLTADADKQRMWNQIRPALRNPVIREIPLSAVPDGAFLLSGISALEKYSDLSGEKCIFQAISKKKLSSVRQSFGFLMPAGEEPVCILQEVGYEIPFKNGMLMDPLSVRLSLTPEDLNDPRTSMAIDNMLSKYVW